MVGKLTGLAGLAKRARCTVVEGKGAVRLAADARGRDARTARKVVSFDHCIIAAGSQSAQIPGFPYDDPRIMDSTGALELADMPKRMLVIGGGIIGLEMATVYDALGSKVTRGRVHGPADAGRRSATSCGRSRSASRSATRRSC